MQLTRSLACEWGRDGIRVNCVAPWMTLTPMLNQATKNDPSALDKVRAQCAAHRPSPRLEHHVH